MHPRTGAAAVLLGAAFFISGAAAAQVPPSDAEVAAYRSLHAAAARGDARQISRLAAGGADPDARDR